MCPCGVLPGVPDELQLGQLLVGLEDGLLGEQFPKDTSGTHTHEGHVL